MKKQAAKILPFPTANRQQSDTPIKTADFATFAFAVDSGKLEFAAKILSHLLSLDPSLALKATEHYEKGVLSEPANFQRRVINIKHEIRSGENIQALESIYYCFGLQGPPAVVALESMRKIATPPQD